MHSSPFTVAGMPLNSSTSSSHSQHSTSTPNLHGWGSSSMNMSTGPGASMAGHGGYGGGGGGGGGMGMSGMGGPATSFSESHGLAQSRSHYQAGYLMSSQNSSSPPGGQHSAYADEPPIVQTKAKMNKILSRGSTADFGMDSMFESTRRQRQKRADEDAPPTSSVFDIPNEIPTTTGSHTPFRAAAALDSSAFRRPQPGTPQQASSTHHRQNSQHQQQQQQPVYLIVFGYPTDKYSLAVEYFQSLGTSVTQPDVNSDIQNCFRIGYHDPAEAMRAARKNGEVLCGSWMIGVKYADPVPFELAQASTSSAPHSMAMDTDSPPVRQAQQVQVQTAPVGTPIRLAPSSSAFRRNAPGQGGGGGGQQQSQQQQSQSQQQQQQGPVRGWEPGLPGGGVDPQAGEGQKKGVLGQVSDLIFGW